MAISYISSNSIQSASMASMPSHQAGDVIIMFAFRRNNNTAPTLPSGWKQLSTGGSGGTASARLAFKVAMSSSETSGTWTNATLLVCHVYRGGVVVDASSMTGGSSATVNYPAMGLQNLCGSGSSWVVAFAGHNSTNGSLATPPTGMTKRQALEGSTADGAGHDTNGAVASWTSKNVASGETASGYRVALVELRPATTFYISAAGSNSNNGLSTSTPWRNWDNPSGCMLGPGDTFAFRGGDTFTDTDRPYYIEGSAGVAAAPITFTSYGTGKATWSLSAPGNGWYANDTGGWVFSNLIISGVGLTNPDAGIFFYRPALGRSDFIQILNCEITGFNDGINIGADDYDRGFSNVLIEGCLFHDNWGTGIVSWGENSGGTYSHNSMTIRNTQFYDMTGNTSQTSGISGFGAFMMNVAGLTVEGCTFRDSGTNNGDTSGNSPAGLLVEYDKNVTVRDCVAYGNKDVQGGFGFQVDFVEGTVLVERCLSYSNGGHGFSVSNIVSGATVTLRHCIAWGNSTVASYYDEMDIWGPAGTILIYNNTFVSRYGDVVQIANGGTGVKFYNNILYAASGTNLVWAGNNYSSSDVLFAGNLYYAAGTFSIYWNDTSLYTSLSAWRTAVSGEEVYNSTNVGVVADPLLAAPGTAPTVTDPTAIGTGADGFKLQSGSPASHSGLSYTDLSVTTAGMTDYWGRLVNQDTPPIGVDHGVIAKIETLTDNFNSGLNAGVWDSSGGAVVPQNGAITLNYGTGSYANAWINTIAWYDLTSSYAFIEVIDPGGRSTGWNQELGVGSSVGGSNNASIYVSDIYGVVCQITNNSSLVFNQGTGSGTYDPAVHRFLRLRAVGTTLYFDTSPNGVTWTNLQSSAAANWSLADVTVWVQAQQGSGGGTASYVTIDNFNTLPAGGFFAMF